MDARWMLSSSNFKSYCCAVQQPERYASCGALESRLLEGLYSRNWAMVRRSGDGTVGSCPKSSAVLDGSARFGSMWQQK